MLCAAPNDTYGTISMKELGLDEILGVRGRNEIVGNIGRCYDGLLIKKSRRKCRVIGSLYIGEKLPNSTYDDILGMIQSGKVDLYLRGEPDYLHENWMAKSVPVHMESVAMMNMVHDPNSVSILNLMDNFKLGIGLISVYFAFFVGVLVSVFLFDELSHRPRSGGMRAVRLARRRTVGISKRIARVVSGFGVKRLTALGMFVLFVRLFLWLTQLFFINNIKTNKVVVDTSELIKDEHDAFATKKIACMLGSGQSAKLIAQTPNKKTLLWRLFHEKTRLRADMQKEREILGQDHCWIGSDSKMFQLMRTDGFVVGERNAKNLLLSMSAFFVDTTIFCNNKIYEYPLVNLFRVDRPDIGRTILRHFENGMIKLMFDCFDKEAIAAARRSKASYFESLDQYIEELSGFSDLMLDNFRYLFLYYALLCSLIFVAFSVHHLVKLVKKRSIFVQSLLRRWLERLTYGVSF